MSGTSNYRLRYVRNVLRHPYIASLSDAVSTLISGLNASNNYYPSRETLSADNDLRVIFSDLSSFPPSAGSEDPIPFNARLALWIESVIIIVSRQKEAFSPLDIESLYRIYQILERL